MPGRWRRVSWALAILRSLVIIVPTIAAAPTMSAPGARPGSTAIRTPDLDESVRWYQEKLGFRLLATRNFVQERTATLERSGFLLEIHEVDHPMPPGASSDPQTTAATRAPLVYLLVPDVDSEVRRLRQEGVEILEEPGDDLEGEYRTAQIRDNGRHRIELREPLSGDVSFNSVGR
jgi:catechol 2,3-dioxygenase-like lactoylglutathione lyase family enzyme